MWAVLGSIPNATGHPPVFVVEIRVLRRGARSCGQSPVPRRWSLLSTHYFTPYSCDYLGCGVLTQSRDSYLALQTAFPFQTIRPFPRTRKDPSAIALGPSSSHSHKALSRAPSIGDRKTSLLSLLGDAEAIGRMFTSFIELSGPALQCSDSNEGKGKKAPKRRKVLILHEKRARIWLSVAQNASPCHVTLQFVTFWLTKLEYVRRKLQFTALINSSGTQQH